MKNEEEKKWYDNTAIIILLIVLFFPVGLYGLWKSRNLSTGWKIVILGLFAIAITVAMKEGKTSTTANKVDSSETKSDSTQKDTASVSKWSYSEEPNDIDNNTTYIAQIEANEPLNFKTPYDGGVDVSIMIRNKNRINDAMIQISKGQFMTKIDNNTIRVKFDNEKPITYSYSQPSDNSTTVIFINNASSFISKLKKAEKTIIECEFFDEGVRTMKFETKGFTFKY